MLQEPLLYTCFVLILVLVHILKGNILLHLIISSQNYMPLRYEAKLTHLVHMLSELWCFCLDLREGSCTLTFLKFVKNSCVLSCRPGGLYIEGVRVVGKV